MVEVVEVEREVASFAPHVARGPAVAGGFLAAGVGFASAEAGQLAASAKVEAFLEKDSIGEAISFAGSEPFPKLTATLVGTEGALRVIHAEAVAGGLRHDGGPLVELAEEGVAPVLAEYPHLVGALWVSVEVDANLVSRFRFLARQVSSPCEDG